MRGSSISASLRYIGHACGKAVARPFPATPLRLYPYYRDLRSKGQSQSTLSRCQNFIYTRKTVLLPAFLWPKSLLYKSLLCFSGLGGKECPKFKIFSKNGSGHFVRTYISSCPPFFVSWSFCCKLFYINSLPFISGVRRPACPRWPGKRGLPNDSRGFAWPACIR